MEKKERCVCRIQGGDRVKYRMKERIENGYGLKGRVGMKDRWRKIKKYERKKKNHGGDRSSNRRRLFWGLSIEAIFTDWLCHCCTQSWSQETLCAFVCKLGLVRGLGASAVVRTGGHAPVWTHSSSPILWSHSHHKGSASILWEFLVPPPCSQFAIVFVWTHGRARWLLFNEPGEQSLSCVYGERFRRVGTSHLGRFPPVFLPLNSGVGEDSLLGFAWHEAFSRSSSVWLQW